MNSIQRLTSHLKIHYKDKIETALNSASNVVSVIFNDNETSLINTTEKYKIINLYYEFEYDILNEIVTCKLGYVLIASSENVFIDFSKVLTQHKHQYFYALLFKTVFEDFVNHNISYWTFEDEVYKMLINELKYK